MTRLPALVFAVVFCQQFTSAQEWGRFRGPNGSGFSPAKTVPVEFTSDDFNWRCELPGTGTSSPVAWGDRVFVTAALEDPPRRSLLCVDTGNGRIRWQREVAFAPYKKHKNNSFASSTPCVDADHVYVLWQSKAESPLIAYDHEGEERWRFDLGPYNHGQGAGTSPIVHEDLVIVSNDHTRGSFLIALDRRTGREVWRIPRAGERACYSTPCVYEVDGRPTELIFTHCFEGITGVDPETGRPNWTIHVFGDFPQRAVGSPFVVGDLIVSNSGARVAAKNLVAVRPAAPGTDEVEEVYRLTRGAPHVPTAVARGDLLFAWNDEGIITCLDAADGSEVWKARVGGTYYGSPICIDDKLYCVDRDGNVVVVAAKDEFELLAKNPLGETSLATPAVSQGVLYVRTARHLHSIGGL